MWNCRAGLSLSSLALKGKIGIHIFPAHHAKPSLFFQSKLPSGAGWHSTETHGRCLPLAGCLPLLFRLFRFPSPLKAPTFGGSRLIPAPPPQTLFSIWRTNISERTSRTGFPTMPSLLLVILLQCSSSLVQAQLCCGAHVAAQVQLRQRCRAV